MNYKNISHRIFVLFIALFAIHACEVVTVEHPDINVDDYYTPEYTIKGRVINANDNGGIADAQVIISDNSISSNNEGYFEFTSNEQIKDGSLVEVIASGFVINNTLVSYGDVSPLTYHLDIYLTPEEDKGNVDLVSGGDISFGSVHVSIPGGNYGILNNDTVYDIDIGVTSLHTNSSLGNQTGGTVKTLLFQPVGISFDKAAVFRIDVASEFVFSQPSLFEYNETDGIWYEMTNEVFYDSITGQIEFSLRSLNTAIKITDPNMITIFSDGIYSESPFIYEPNSCDCEGAYLWSGGYYIRQLTITGTGVLNELNSMHFFSDNNMPYYPALYITGIFEAPVVTNLSIPECKIVVVEISRWYREISGTYVYVNETKTFNVRYYFGVSVTTSIEDCPVTSNCHQGCI